MNKKTKIILGIVVVIAITILLNFFNKKEIGVLKIGGAFALTGDAASWGEESLDSANLAVDEINKSGGINGRKLKLVVEDIKSSSKDSVSAVSKLVNIDKVDAIIITWLDSYQGSESIVPKNIPLISPDAAIESVNSLKKNQNVFSLWYRTSSKAKVTFDEIEKSNIKNIYLVTQNDSYYTTLVDFLKKEALKDNVTIVGNESLNPGTDVKTVISKIKSVNPDAVFFGAYDEKLSVDFPKKYNELINKKIPLYGDEFIDQNILAKKINPEWVEGVKYYVPDVLGNSFAEKYRNVFSKAPQFSASNTYDTVYLIAKYLSDNPKDLNTYMRKTEFNTVTYGKIKFDDMGGVISDKDGIVMKIVKNGLVENIK